MVYLKLILQPTGLSVDFGVRSIIIRDGENIRLGRVIHGEVEKENNCLFNTKVVSSTHAILNNRNSQCLLEDRSRNGTFLNGVKLAPRIQYEIINGDIIEMGMAAFITEVKVPGIMIDVKLEIIEDKFQPLFQLIIPEEEPFHDAVSQPISNESPTCLSDYQSTLQDCSLTSVQVESDSDDVERDENSCSPSVSCFANTNESHKLSNPRSSKIHLKRITTNSDWSDSSESLSLYFVHPSMEYALEDLFKCTLERYDLLKIVADSAGNHSRLENDKHIETFCSKLEKENISRFYSMIVEGSTDSTILLMDQVSHFCLRFACSRSYEALKWFTRQETKLLHIKWTLSSTEKRECFLKKYKFEYNKALPQEIDAFRSAEMEEETLFKVPFEQVPNLVGKRSVPIYKGFAYLTHQQLIFVVTDYFSKYLDSSLRFAKKWQSTLKYDPRLTPFFNKISEDIRVKFFNFSIPSGGSIKLSEIDKLSEESFPLCMEVLYYHLKKNNHLRNGGRFQFNLFLKGIGLSLNNAIRFWSGYFLKKMSHKEFQQKYLYHIRHGYGKLGKHADYPPLSCSKIFESVLGPMDYHGCPFTISHEKVLMSNLGRHSAPPELKTEIWNLVQASRPQTACGVFFNFKHSLKSLGSPTDHPNIYYNRSRAVRKHIKITGDPAVQKTSSSSSCRCNINELDW